MDQNTTPEMIQVFFSRHPELTPVPFSDQQIQIVKALVQELVTDALIKNNNDQSNQ